jgi:hypothetical protein
MSQAIAFRAGACRHRKSLVYSIPFQAGQRIMLPLNNVGYLNELQIMLNLTVTLGVAITVGTTTDDQAAASNFLPYVNLQTPQGEQVWTTNSRDLYDFQYRLFFGDQGALGIPSAAPPLFATGNNAAQAQGGPVAFDPAYAMYVLATTTAQTVIVRFRVPVAFSDGDNFDMGMLMRQISNNQFYLTLQMAQTTDLFGNATGGTFTTSTVTGSIIVEEIYYEAVASNGPVQPPNFTNIVRLRSAQTSSLVAGLNDLRYDQGPVLCDALIRPMNTGVADTTAPTTTVNPSNIGYIQLLANLGNEVDNRTGYRLRYDNALHLGKVMRPGVFHEDFFDDCGGGTIVNVTRMRDFINSNAASQIDFWLQYNGTPGAGSNIAAFYREVVALGG